MSPKDDINDVPVLIATAPNLAIGAAWQEVLRGKGIQSMGKMEDSLAISSYSTSAAPYRIYVAAGDAEEARKILEPLVSPSPLEDEVPDEDTSDGDS